MNQLEIIKENIIPLINSKNVELYDLIWRQEDGMKILQVSILNINNTMDLEVCAEVSELVSNKLDELDIIQDEYYLEVCSPGAERILKDEAQVKDALNEYVFIKLIEPINNIYEVKGYLREFDGLHMIIDYMDKAVKKKLEIQYSNVSLIRLSVKI